MEYISQSGPHSGFGLSQFVVVDISIFPSSLDSGEGFQVQVQLETETLIFSLVLPGLFHTVVAISWEADKV